MALSLADGPRRGATAASIMTLLSPPWHFGFCHRRCGFRSGCRRCPEARRAASMTPLLVGVASAGRPTVALCCSACALCVQPVVSGDCLDGAQRLKTKPSEALASCLLAHQLPCPRHVYMHNANAMREHPREIHKTRIRCRTKPPKIIATPMCTSWLAARCPSLDTPSNGFTAAGGRCSLPLPSRGFAVAGKRELRNNAFIT